MIGKGDTIILCNRFRGMLDTWDPAFLDSLAAQYRVIIFDYTGIGLSTGELPIEIARVAKDVKDLADALKIDKFILGGWSYGGFVVQTFATHYPSRITQLVLIGTNPPGENKFPVEQVFIDTSSHLYNDLDDEIILFFEPASVASSYAAKLSHDRILQRITDNDMAVPQEKWPRYFQGGLDYVSDKNNAREKLGQLQVPVLVISGDHDIVFPVENWCALTRKMTNLYLVVLPQAGHGPQHQYPQLCARYIIDFIAYNNR